MGTASMGSAVARWRLVASVLALVVVLVVVAQGLNVDSVAAELSHADLGLVGLALLGALGAQLAWAAATARVLGTVIPEARGGRIRLGYLTGTFAKQVLPFGHAGGVPLLAYVFAEDLDTDYRRTFAAVTASELLIFLASLVVAAVGILVFALTSPWAIRTGGVAVGIVVGGAIVGGLGGRYLLRRAVLLRVALGVATLGRATLGRVVPRVNAMLAEEAVRRSLSNVRGTFRQATADRTILAWTAGYAVLGWVLFALPLYLGFRAIGAPVPLALALFLVPAGGLATLLPIPGGLGGTEVATAAAVVFLTGHGLDVAAAGVLLYRLATYWFVVAVGGLSALYLSVGLVNLSPAESR